MEYVNPIKDVESIQKMKEILRKQSQRDLLFFVFGINTGLRVSDLLTLKVGDVYDEKGIKEFLYIKDKNNQQKAFYINEQVKKELKTYLDSNQFKEDDYLFKSRKDNNPITRQQAYRIINQAAKEAGIPGKIGTQTLRKTFGYHAYRKGIAVSILMDILNQHSRSGIMHYIGIDKDELEPIRVDVNL